MSTDAREAEMPLPDDYERELLTICMEECAGAAIRASKLIRFGRDEVQPGQGLTNAQRLAEELGDIRGVVDLLVAAGLVVDRDIRLAAIAKREKLKVYLQHQPRALTRPEGEK